MSTFRTGDVLSVATGILVGGIGGVYEVIDGMTGVAHLTHQLPGAQPAVAAELARQLPWLADVVVPEGITDQQGADAFVATVAAVHGEHQELEPMADYDAPGFFDGIPEGMPVTAVVVSDQEDKQ